MAKIFWMVFVILPVTMLIYLSIMVLDKPAFACMVGPNWEKETAAKADKNKDGKIDYAEYKAMHSWNAADERIARNNWDAEAKGRANISVEEFLSGFRPKCGG